MVQLLIAELGCQHLVELQFARSLSHHHRVAHAGVMPDTAGGNHGEELHVMQVRINDENLQNENQRGSPAVLLEGGIFVSLMLMLIQSAWSSAIVSGMENQSGDYVVAFVLRIICQLAHNVFY
jgi:hypothetical protein